MPLIDPHQHSHWSFLQSISSPLSVYRRTSIIIGINKTVFRIDFFFQLVTPQLTCFFSSASTVRVISLMGNVMKGLYRSCVLNFWWRFYLWLALFWIIQFHEKCRYKAVILTLCKIILSWFRFIFVTCLAVLLYWA